MPQSFLEFLLADVLLNGAIYAAFVVPAYLLCWVACARRLQHRRIQPHRRAHARAIRHDIAYSLLSLVTFAVVDLAAALLDAHGLTCLYPDIDQRGLAWFILSVPLVILLHDAYFYWTHRAMHHPRLYRLVHRVHHRSTDPSPFTSFAFHPLEAVVENGFTLLVILVLPLHFAALLTWQLFQQLFNMIGHLGYELYPAWWLRAPGLRWKTASTHHNLHHQLFVGNYGLYFTWWDRWLGTELPQYAERFAQATQPRRDPMTPMLPRSLTTLMVATDLAFVAYWLVTALHLLPPELLYNDYNDPWMVDWNWSFLPIDLLVSLTGFAALLAARRRSPASTQLALVSLTLTSASGLMALSFWTLRHDLDPAWWLPNLFLLLYPLPFLRRLLTARSAP